MLGMNDDFTFAMSAYWYEQWYKQKVSPNLSREDKLKLIQKISDLSLREPIFHGGLYYPKEDFPELTPYVTKGIQGKHPVTKKKGELTGVQLYTVLMLAAQELGFPTTRASQTHFKKPLMQDLPVFSKKIFDRPDLETDTSPHVGTNLIPNVVNPTGCKSVNGTWTDGVCLLKDTPTEGYTAPIKGAYFYWNTDGKMIETIGGCHVYGDDYYPRGIGTCNSKLIVNMGITREPKRARTAAIRLAKKVIEGKANEYNLTYLNIRGVETPYDSNEAVVANKNNTVKKLYRDIKFGPHRKPFCARAGCRPR
jgi:hypothetical protein